MAVSIIHGDCLAVLPTLEAGSFHACVTDAPYELNFMNRSWDRTGIAFRPETWAAVLRVLKPGGYLLAFGGTRTQHRLICAIEDAGFEIRDIILWHYGSGFPKSHNVTNQLLSMPPCCCKVAEISSHASVVDASKPAGFIGAGIGTEPRTMPMAGVSTDSASRLCLESGPVTLGRLATVQTGNEDLFGQDDPVMFGALGVAVGAEGNEVASIIRRVEAEPEALWDEVMGNETNAAAAIDARAIPSDDRSCARLPEPTLIAPSTTAPCGVAATSEARRVINGHAGSGAVDSALKVTPKFAGADAAGEAFVAPSHAAENSMSRQALEVCSTCGGRIGHVPEGLGTALKPATEIICVARKPLSESTVAANCLRHGTGALNIDASRVGTVPRATHRRDGNRQGTHAAPGDWGKSTAHETNGASARWPANVCHDGSPEVMDAFARFGRTDSSAADAFKPMQRQDNNIFGRGLGTISPDNTYSDSGTVARFFYAAKAGQDERLDSKHPTIKPVALMEWLVRLVTPPGGRVLDPFCGTGSTLVACDRLGFDAVGIEQDAQTVADAHEKLRRMRARRMIGDADRAPVAPGQMTLL